MDEKKIERINELARKKRESSLTAEEAAEQEKLRREYIDSYKRSLVAQLDNTYYIDEKGFKRKVKKKD